MTDTLISWGEQYDRCSSGCYADYKQVQYKEEKVATYNPVAVDRSFNKMFESVNPALLWKTQSSLQR